MENDNFDGSAYLAQLDQGCEGARDMAKLTAAYFLQLIKEEVPEEQAGKMAAAYVSGTMGQRKD